MHYQNKTTTGLPWEGPNNHSPSQAGTFVFTCTTKQA
ncbi:hypothetical protein J417_00855 [Dickeya zeae MS1]|nr:hypothetical protein J417_00855 [Dickeya zeae MS1]UJR56869.1 hypothetical protein HJ580_00910 [Dickeya zeae]